jgi:Protein of unknown function (DUF1553)
MLQGIKIAAKVYEKNSALTLEKQKLINEARAREDKAAAKEIGKEISKLQNEGRRASMQEILLPGQKKLFAKVTGKSFDSKNQQGQGQEIAQAGAGDMMMMSNVYGARIETVRVPGYDRAEISKEQRQAEQLARNVALEDEATFFGIGVKERKEYFRARERQVKETVRSAELESPAPRGHYLREFGQSDRELIENANNDASVPQALAMMNGSLMPQILSQYSQLSLTVRKAPYPDEKIDAIYMTVLSRKPTTAEKALWLKAQDKGLTSIEDLVYSLLNTQQFIFIQ